MRVQLGAGSATWWTSNFDLNEWDRNDARIIVGNDSVTMVLRGGEPDPVAFGHLAFHAADLAALAAARDALRANGVALEDPGDEIGPVAPGSSSMGLWFHDLDGYRWELFVGAPTDT
jgi:catechol 2,3-dioxygenase-like lactoylglutathione lyase family enzyme